jgi:hypothetical protein
MFSNADAFDYLLMVLGTLGGIATGLAFPAFNILFGRMINTLNGGDVNFADAVAQLCISFVVIAVINLFSGFFQVSERYRILSTGCSLTCVFWQ